MNSENGPYNRDSALLDELAKVGENLGERWICRRSTTGRGLRLHQTSSEKLIDGSYRQSLTGLPTFETPREAIEDFLEREDTRETC